MVNGINGFHLGSANVIFLIFFFLIDIFVHVYVLMEGCSMSPGSGGMLVSRGGLGCFFCRASKFDLSCQLLSLNDTIKQQKI